VRWHYATGAELVDAFAEKPRRLPDVAIPYLRTLAEGCAVRERCRLRRSRRGESRPT
jgi:hypothetical protein